MATKKTVLPASCGPIVKMIEVKTWKGQQSAHFRKLVQINLFKVKIDIKRDSYDMQSHAIAYVFDPATMDWKVVYSIPYPHMQTEKGLHLGNQVLTTVPFAKDSEALMAGISSILF